MAGRMLHPKADRLLVVLSDIEMGAGGRTDDFPHSEWLGDLLLSYNEPPYDRLAVELVFNGDTFDLLKTSVDGEYPRHVTAEIALAKMRRIADTHAPFFEALRRFLAHEGPERRVHFVVGNHDFELLFPEVQEAIRKMLDDSPRVFFPGLELRIADVHIEHGNQHDRLFRVEEPWFVEYQGERILSLPWGAVALLDVAIPLQPILYHHDRLKPRQTVIDLMPDVQEAVVTAYWEYWTRDWARSVFLGDDPLKSVSWTMLQEVAYRFRTRSGMITVRDHFEELLRQDNGPRVYLVGHEHSPLLVSYGDRRLLMTGAFRDEYMLEDQGRQQRTVPKTYAEVFLDGERTVRADLVDVDGPPPPEGYIPDSIFNVLDAVKARLLELPEQERKRLVDAQARQAQKEADEG